MRANDKIKCIKKKVLEGEEFSGIESKYFKMVWTRGE